MNVLIGYSDTELENSVVPSVEKEKVLSIIREKLTAHGLCVTKLEKKDSVGEHVWTRDNFFVLGGKCFLCNVTSSDTLKHDRKPEQLNTMKFLQSRYGSDSIIRIPFPIEGGDVVVSGDDVFVGIGKRTTVDAFHFLERHFEFGNFRFHRVAHDDLHLDCCFAVLGDTVLYNGSRLSADDITSIDDSSNTSSFRFQFRDLDEVSQDNLNTNFITTGKVVFHGKLSREMLNLFRSKGYEVVQIAELNKMYAEGGGIRCLTQFF